MLVLADSFFEPPLRGARRQGKENMLAGNTPVHIYSGADTCYDIGLHDRFLVPAAAELMWETSITEYH